MKKIYLFLVVALMASMSLPAQKVGYLLTAATIDALPPENYGGEDQKPEQNAANWFVRAYGSNAELVQLSDLASLDPATVKVLWINVDRTGLADLAAAGIDAAAVEAIGDYVKAGGNLLLTKQAAHLAYSTGRIGYAPNWNNVGYNDVGDTWYIKTKLGGGTANQTDRSNHDIYKNIAMDANGQFPLVGAVKRSDRNNHWSDFFRKDPNTGGILDDSDPSTHYDNGNVQRLVDFEEDWKCEALATWPQIDDYCLPMIINFNPNYGDFQGRMLAICLAAYQWGKASYEDTDGPIANVKKLTQNCIEYLYGSDPRPQVEASWNVTPADGTIGGSMTASVTTTGTISWSSSDNTVASVSSEGVIAYNGFGSCTITAVVSKDGCADKNLEQTITVTGGTLTKYAYALPYSLYTMSTYTNEDGTWKPDYQAAKWFYDNYVVTGKGCFINPTDYSASATIPTTIEVLWVNNDHKDLSTNDLKTAFGDNNFVNALSAFVEAGGNVFLSKQTTRFVHDIGRAIWEPCYEVGDDCPEDGTWYMVDNFVAVDKEHGGVNLHNHPVYATLRATKADQYTEHKWMDGSEEKNEGYCKWPLFDGTGNRTRMTYIWGEPPSNFYGLNENTLSKDRFDDFENGMQCKILGGWGHTTALDAVGFAEFPPATINAKVFRGSVICIGLPAYQWSVGNTYIKNVRALTQGILDYLGGVVVVTDPGTTLTNTTVDDLVVYQGGSVSNTEDITIKNSITYIRPAVGGTAENELGHWYTFCLPFTPSHCYVHEEGDQDYEINSVYLSSVAGETESNPLGPGSFYLQTFAPPAGWAYIGGEGKPREVTAYIIKFLDGSENSGLADYFISNPIVKFVGGAQTIDGTDEGTGGTPNGDYSYHVNHTLRKLTMRHVYPLNTATNMFEYDYGGPSEIMPFECYVKASTPALAAACPRFAIGRGAQQGTEITTAVETVAAPLQPLRIYDIMGRLFHTGDEPRQLPQGIWIVRQGKDSRTIVVP